MTDTELYQIHNDALRLNFHAGQAEAWDSRQRITAIIAGTQSGKTSWGPYWLLREIYGDAVIGENYDGLGSGDYLSVTANYDLFKLKLLPELKRVFEREFGLGRYWAGLKVMELKDPATGKFWANNADDPMWGRIILRSANAEGGLESATAQAAWLDEAGHPDFTLQAYEAIRRRLSLSRGRILITTTPYNLGWLKQKIYDRRVSGGVDVVQFVSTMNPKFSVEEFEEMREELPGWKFRMFYMGQFERPAGMIYGDFVDELRDRGGHKVEPFELPKQMPRYVGVDPGLEHQARVWMAHDVPHDVYYVYRAERPEKKSTREHVEDVQARVKREAVNVVAFGVGAKSEEQQRVDWRDAGIANAMEPPFHDVESGIDKIISLLRQHRIFFFEDDGENGMSHLFDEIATYSRKLDNEDRPTEAIKDKEKYHLLDSLRYAVALTTDVYEEAGAINYAPRYTFSQSEY